MILCILCTFKVHLLACNCRTGVNRIIYSSGSQAQSLKFMFSDVCIGLHSTLNTSRAIITFVLVCRK